MLEKEPIKVVLIREGHPDIAGEVLAGRWNLPPVVLHGGEAYYRWQAAHEHGLPYLWRETPRLGGVLTEEQGRALRRAVECLDSANQYIKDELDPDEDDEEDAAERVVEARAVLAELGVASSGAPPDPPAAA